MGRRGSCRICGDHRLNPDIDFSAVCRAIEEVASAEIKPKLGALSRSEISEKSAGDFVTSADLAVERQLGERLRDIMPSADILGEEAVAEGRASVASLRDDRLHWVIDPIDGTGNFATGYPLVAVIVSLIQADEILAGWIHDPFGNRTLEASLGGGAWMSGRRLSCHRPDDLRLMNGSVYGRRFRDRPLFQDTWGRGRAKLGAIWNARCVGHEHLARVSGLAHFGCYSRLLPWDHAAGFLMHREAGGIARRIDGSCYRPSDPSIGGLLAPDREIWRELWNILVGDGEPPELEAD